ncbi:hypothetical protein M9H61_11480 [Thalassospira sp. GO-4]|jgi:hypothetical protein|uniref:hypothetical protein n=1 Tax=Thalassospira sp. GO-4 TaxID=2946605 RepID=UPI0020245005|nr:hypothetical protein [Thalassospira sp. GO-4]URK16171.1 hypothetical protein M9H61_11480 [Thalassospira sp. GO-4]
MKKTKNESECCEIVVQLLEKKTGYNRSAETIPDLVDRNNKAADRYIELGPTRYLIEHTTIQPYPESRKSDAQFQKFCALFSDRGSQRISNEMSAELNLSYAIHTIPDSRIHNFFEAVMNWVEVTLPKSPNLNEGRLFEVFKTNIDQIDIDLVVRAPEIFRGQLRPQRQSPSNLEELRFSVIENALAKKLSKFSQENSKTALTVLVFEFDDLALSAHPNIISKIEKLCTKCENIPHELFLIDTYQSPWKIWHVIDNQKIKLDRYQNL